MGEQRGDMTNIDTSASDASKSILPAKINGNLNQQGKIEHAGPPQRALDLVGRQFHQSTDPTKARRVSGIVENEADNQQVYEQKIQEIDKKVKEGEDLDPFELRLLYRNNQTRQVSPGIKQRVDQLRAQRDPREDLTVIYGCDRDQIAYSASEMGPNTTVYVGPLFPNIFRTAPSLEAIYPAFPGNETAIRHSSLQIGGKTKEQLQQGLEQAGVHISDAVRELIPSRHFKVFSKPQALDVITLQIKDLGLPDLPPLPEHSNFGSKPGYSSMDVYKRAQELGLELCPSETAPQLAMQNKNRPIGSLVSVTSREVTLTKEPYLFNLRPTAEGLSLHAFVPEKGFYKWAPNAELIFSLSSKNANYLSRVGQKIPSGLKRFVDRFRS